MAKHTLRGYMLPNLDLTMTQMIQKNLQFRGTIMEVLNQHLIRFLQLCDTFKFNRFIDDAIHLRLFLFSLIANSFS
ncbi:RING-H2 finger protein ATL63 [Gossypium australe]|uniref:RING-H2 finger protein ATL63 n=1 Tax=Gossypium australe TaxID=47621 RepID=A0A5B6WQB9_9ROSI|nr:RING-H2 finger protein ATL63 [Gossypium australe]